MGVLTVTSGWCPDLLSVCQDVVYVVEPRALSSSGRGGAPAG